MKTFLALATEGILVSGLAITLDILHTANFLIERKHESQSYRIVTARHRKKIRTGAGLLKGRKATTSWWLATAFRQRYPDVILYEAKMLVRDGNILTAGAVFSQMHVVSDIVAEVVASSIANLCSRYLLLEPHLSQARCMVPT